MQQLTDLAQMHVNTKTLIYTKILKILIKNAKTN